MPAKFRPGNIPIIREILRQEGFSEMAISASLARFKSESEFDPRALNPNDAGKGRHSHGILQWNDGKLKRGKPSKGRLTQLKAYAASIGMDWNDVRAQTRFFAREVKGEIGTEGVYGRKLLSARTPEEAAKASISLARPKYWSAAAPERGLGFSKTLKLTRMYARGDYSAPGSSSRTTDTGAPIEPYEVTRQPDTKAGAREREAMNNPILQAFATYDPTSGVNSEVGEQFGPVMPPGFLDPHGPMGRQELDPNDPPLSDGGPMAILAGIASAFSKSDEESNRGLSLSVPLLENEMNRPTRIAPNVASILSMIRV